MVNGVALDPGCLITGLVIITTKLHLTRVMPSFYLPSNGQYHLDLIPEGQVAMSSYLYKQISVYMRVHFLDVVV